MADKTVISLPAQDLTYDIPGLWTEAQIRSNYAQQIAGLASMTAVSSDATGADGTTRTVTFSPRTGQKG